MSKKKLVPVLLIAIAGAVWYGYDNYYTEQDGSEDIIYGNVDIREVKPAFRQSGRIEHIYVDEGQRVMQGDLLAELDPIPLQEQVNLSQAQLAVAEAQLDDLLAGPRPQEIESAKQEVLRLSATVNNAKDNYNRHKNLIKTGSTSAGNLDNAQAQYDEAKAALAGARQRLSLLQEGTKSESLLIAKQQIKVAEAQLAIKETALQDTRLYAPEDAIVLTRILEPGSIVNAGSPVLSLSLSDPTYVRAYIDETRLGAISPGDEVSIYTDASTQSFSGTIGFISPKAEFTPKSVETPELRTSLVYRLRIVVRGEDEGLNQGQPVTIALH